MSREQQLRLHGHGGNDEEHVHRGDEESDEESDIPSTSSYVSSDIIHMIDTFVRPANTFAEQGSYVSGLKDKQGKRILKAGYIAEAGFGRARAEYSVFEAEARGPNASVGAEASLVGAGAMARAEIASASAKAGPVGVKVGLGFDTGLIAGLDGAEAKVLGTGFSVGSRTSVSVLGNEASCSVM